MTAGGRKTRQLIADMDQWHGDNAGRLTIYAEGVCYASVCTDLSDEEADARMAAHPSRWARAADPFFADRTPSPSPCGQNPTTHRHILYEA